jgi:hypothetical protein
MTILLEENAAGESSSAPPRKKLRLSLSRRSNQVRVPRNKTAHVNKSTLENTAGNDFKDQKLSISPVQSDSTTDFGDSQKASTSLANCEEDSLHSGNNLLLKLYEYILINQN